MWHVGHTIMWEVAEDDSKDGFPTKFEYTKIEKKRNFTKYKK